ncbi:hypothetical protein L21SP3_00656 [Sedimentisphaera cyanobacteriorum]|uniref:Uncharacterized protein n=1 Tax=Sedimentisphaera cyanobacteriorum TaxID=1940790 RepID=A0A1Q2HNR9_9BACT|nr:GxGYxYP domain-containing protein [Sedimentisphaera cyanobacteriorum]AQQ08863.1 hypothetical protein L21SP3_00656 [Sedimentisphaera cyanobacteriorum]
MLKGINRCCVFMLAVLTLFCFVSYAQVEYDRSYSPLKNGGAERQLSGWETEACESKEIPNSGDRCFELDVKAGSRAQMRSDLINIRRSENFCLEYSMKAQDYFNETASLYLIVRSYGSQGENVLSADKRKLRAQNKNWEQGSEKFAAHPGAYFVDVQFSVRGFSEDEAGILLDEIALYREIDYDPLYGEIKPISKGDSLITFPMQRRSKGAVSIAVQSLQGVTARTEGPKIWMDTGDETFLNYLKEQFRISLDRSYENDFPGLLKAMKKYTSGRYVLYDLDYKPSISAANTMAGLKDAAAVDKSLEKTFIEAGYKLAADVSRKDCEWVYNNYREQIRDAAIIVHTNDMRRHPSVFHLKDFAPAVKALNWWHSDEELSRSVYRSMEPVSPVYGWQDGTTSDEGLTVKLHSEEGLFQMPSDWMVNLSVHASTGPAMKNQNFKQKVSRDKPENEKNVHYVTFIMSDMDNILTEIGSNSFFSEEKFYANEHRGEFPMSWGMAPSLVELSPAGVDMWYDAATENDAFVGYCGLGYFYPYHAPYMQTHAQRLTGFLKRADLRTLLLIDRIMPESRLSQDYYDKIKYFTSLDQLRGFFFMEYVKYAPYNGKILWFDGKPMVCARFDFRDEKFYSAVRSTPEEIADSINELPANPNIPEGYTFVTVHAWSRGMDDIRNTIKKLDSDVRVVNAEDFIELIRLNVEH